MNLLFVWLISMHERDWRMWSGKTLINSEVNSKWCKLAPIICLSVAYIWACLTSSLCLFSQVVALSSWSLLRDSIYYTLSVVALIVVSFQRLLYILFFCGSPHVCCRGISLRNQSFVAKVLTLGAIWFFCLRKNECVVSVVL